MLFGLFEKKDEGGPPFYIHTIAIPLIVAGIGILAAPDLRDFVLHLLDKVLRTQLDFNQSQATGWVLLGCGLCVYAIERLTWNFGGQPIFALRHQSFLPLPPTLTRQDLPRRFAMKRVRSIDCDLFALMNANPQKVDASLTVQWEWAQKAVGAITGSPDAPVAYYGIVHIPFQFLAGSRFSTYRRIELFELERGTGHWRPLLKSKKPKPLSVRIDREGLSNPFEDVAIRISVSYTVSRNDIAKVLPSHFADIHLRIDNPRIDAIETMDDVLGICAAFRKVIDDDHIRGNRLHIFYSGPVSLGFSLGQRINPTIHGEVRVYNYDAGASPKYNWDILLTHAPSEEHVRHH
jgi:hypothetical protein